MKILIIADPIHSLNPKSDTGLMLAQEALSRNHAVYWTEPKHIGLIHNHVFILSKKLKPFSSGETPKTESESKNNLKDFHTVWIRKDPPFNSEYVHLCWLLRLRKNNKPLILNPPETLLLCHEKLLPFLGVSQGFLSSTDLIPSSLSFDGLNKIASSHPFFKKPSLKDTIVKPWLGFGGSEIRKFNSYPDAQIFLNKNKKEPFLIQPFLKKIKTLGDRRAYFLNARYQGGFIRLPKKGGYVSNIAQGGSGHLIPLSNKEKKVIKKIEAFLKKNNIFFAGVDLIDGLVSEVNVTAPTGLQKYKTLTKGIDLASVYVDLVEKEIKKK